MSTSTLFEQASSIVFLIIGAWATAYAYGFVGERIIGRWHWNSKFRLPLRWLGPVLVGLCLVSFFFNL